MADLHEDIVHFVRFVVEGKVTDAAHMGRRLLREVVKQRPEFASAAASLTPQLTPSVIRRSFPAAPRAEGPVPVDDDSRLELVRRVDARDSARFGDLRWPTQVQRALDAIVQERERSTELRAVGVEPTRSALFVGPPGVGKTVAAHLIASRLGRELLVLDLAAVMSSFLGRTGNNIRAVLDYAARSGSVLLLDEFDAIAKRRDDASDVGELRRLVNVLLQSIDEWPSTGILIAATNHSELLDPAVWRRFDRVVAFSNPDSRAVRTLVARDLGQQAEVSVDVVSALLEGSSYAEIVRELANARRESVLSSVPLAESILASVGDRVRGLPTARRLEIAGMLLARDHSQRRVHELTGLSRDTIRKHQPKKEAEADGT